MNYHVFITALQAPSEANDGHRIPFRLTNPRWKTREGIERATSFRSSSLLNYVSPSEATRIRWASAIAHWRDPKTTFVDCTLPSIRKACKTLAASWRPSECIGRHWCTLRLTWPRTLHTGCDFFFKYSDRILLVRIWPSNSSCTGCIFAFWKPPTSILNILPMRHAKAKWNIYKVFSR
jgi:hypothetical protein